MRTAAPLRGSVASLIVAAKRSSRGIERSRFRAIAGDKNRPLEERFDAAIKLAALPRNGSATRIRNRCEVTGRPRAYYRKLKMSRIALRDLGSKGLIPGMVKSSW